MISGVIEEKVENCNSSALILSVAHPPIAASTGPKWLFDLSVAAYSEILQVHQTKSIMLRGWIIDLV